MNVPKNIYFLLSNPPTERDMHRFGVYVLRKRGFNVETFDMTDVSYSYFKYMFSGKNGIVIGTYVPKININNILIYRFIRKSPLKYAQLSVNTLPIGKGIKEAVVMKTLCQIDYQIKDGTYKFPYGNEVIYTHTMDYDRHLESSGEKPFDYDYFVFIDQGFGRHPDENIDREKPCKDITVYYKELLDTLERIGDNMEAEIVISQHPRAKSINDLFYDRAVVSGNLPNLIRYSKGIITHYSTAINFAVIYKKPIIFIQPKSITNKRYIKRMRLFKKRFLGKFEEVYKKYMQEFIKTEGSPEKNSWEIFADYILQ